MNQPPAPAPTYNIVPAGLPTRIAAAIIDLVLTGILLLVLSAIFGGADTSSDNGRSSVTVHLSGLPALVYFVLTFAYFWLLEGIRGQTLGKLSMGIGVVSASGDAIGLKNSLLRQIVRIVDFLPFLYVLGFIVAVANKQHQRLGDMAAGSFVIDAR